MEFIQLQSTLLWKALGMDFPSLCLLPNHLFSSFHHVSQEEKNKEEKDE